MKMFTPGLEEELKRNVAKCYGAERTLRSAIGAADDPLLREYLMECALLYGGIGDLLCLSVASEGTKVLGGPGAQDPLARAWMDLGPARHDGGDVEIRRRVAQGHAGAVLDMNATLERNGIPENIEMVLLKGIGRILEELNRDDIVPGPGRRIF